jgi:hypothetical protein
MKTEESTNQWFKRFRQNGSITNGVWFLWNCNKLTQGEIKMKAKKWDYAAISWLALWSVVVLSVCAGYISGLFN